MSCIWIVSTYRRKENEVRALWKACSELTSHFEVSMSDAGDLVDGFADFRCELGLEEHFARDVVFRRKFGRDVDFTRFRVER